MEDVEVEYVIIKDVEHGGMYVATKVRIAYRGGGTDSASSGRS